MMTKFDHTDIEYLCDTFTEIGLRAEIHWAKMEATVSDAFRGTEYELPNDNFPYHDYTLLCEQAIAVLKSVKRHFEKPTKRIDAAVIKSRVDLLSEVERYTTLKKSGNRFIGQCPLHEDKHPSFVVYPDQQSWHCFQCGQGGDVFAFIQTVENTDFRGAIAILGNR